MASSRSTIDIVIGTVCKLTGIDAARRAMKNLASGVGKNLMNIKAGFDLAAAGLRKFAGAMSKGMEFERMTVQFKSLTGSLDLARSHMQDLLELSKTPPFNLEQFASASRAMLKMTNGMAGYKHEMEVVGDMAAATGNDITAVGHAFGLAYQVIRDGQDFGRAGQQLYNLGILTKKQVAEFAELSKAGTDNAQVWAALQQEFSRYRGAMKDTESTTKGLVEAIGGEANAALTEFSSAISDAAKPALEGLLGYLRRINEDGTIEDWADTAVEKMQEVATACGTLGDALVSMWKKSGFSDAYAAIKAGVGGLGYSVTRGISGLSNGESFSEAMSAASTESRAFARRQLAQGYYLKGLSENGSLGSAMQEAAADNAADSNYRADRRERRALDRAKKREEERAKAEEEAQSRMADDLARAQAETDAKRAEEAEASARKAAEAEYQAQEKILAQLTAEKVKAEQELHDLRVKNLNDELSKSQNAGSKRESIIQRATTEFDKAFGMYRSEDHGAAQIAEERDYAADYKQLQKDARRSGQGWRIDELSALMANGDTQGQAAKLEEWRKSSRFTPEVESMVRAAAADQTKTTAEDELRKIEANTASLADKLDQLLSVK